MTEQIFVTKKPTFGRFERECVCCNDYYTSFHLYLCRLCEVSCEPEIIEMWSSR